MFVIWHPIWLTVVVTTQNLYKKKSYRIYIKLHKIVELIMSWPVVVSKLCSNNNKMTNIRRKY